MKNLSTLYKGKTFSIVLISIACFIFYGNSIQNKYAFDDFIVITQNQFTKSGIKGIPDIFKYDSWVGCFGHDPKYVVGGRYRPLSLVTFALEYQLFGQNPHVSHFNNIILFIVTAWLLFITLSKIFARYVSEDENIFFSFPFFAVLLFIAHPIHTEVVANIKGRDEIMTLLGSLATILFILKYIDTDKVLYLIWAFISFLLALLSKENAITFLAIVPLSIFYYKRVKPSVYFYSLLPLITASIVFFWIRNIALGDTPAPAEDFISNALIDATITQKYATIFYALGLYIKLLVFPHPLTLDYYPNHITLVDWTNVVAILSFIIHFALVLYALINLSKKSVLAYGILFYVITLSIVSNLFFPIGGTVMAERFIFISSIGFVLAVAWLISTKIFVFIKSDYMKASFIISILLLWFIKTYSRNKVWMDDLTLFTTDVKTSFNSRKSNIAVSTVLLERANQISDSLLIKKYRADALYYAKRAATIFPNYIDALYRLGNAYAENNKLDSALICYKKTIELSPDLKDIIVDKILAVLKSNEDTDFKINTYLELLKLAPDNFNLNFQIGYCFGRYKNDLKQSLSYLGRAYEIQPDNFDVNNNLGIAYKLAGDYNKSSFYLERTVKISPHDMDAWERLYNTYNLAGNHEKENEVLQRIKEMEMSNAQ